MELALRRDATGIATMSRDLVEAGLGWSWTPSRVAHCIQCPDTVVLVARARAGIAGFAIMGFATEDAHLNLLAVDPEHRFSGIGKRMIRWLEKSALVAGISVIYLEVRASNTGAQSFYRRLGYQPICRVTGYYSGRESAVRMARDLWCTETQVQ